ncbi:MAG: hypothetical protein COZ69_01985 [Deltaproteobacteria bacterium CG_4_8_14_3_um_filter_45_9]|nr:MAG: hypothetical protein COZ69_01985 [Deltaproteobacteria bacterium CG_4_8_14_3_um_filter_45_9]
MKRFRWQILLGLCFIVLSTILYLIHYTIFRDSHHIFLYLIGDIAFLPIEVLLVTLIIDQLLSAREKRALLKKMNMVIGSFFSEAGNQLLKSFSDFASHEDQIKKDLVENNDWSNKAFSNITKHLKGYDYRVESQKGNLEGLKNFFLEKRGFLLGLLENPNLLEHESFTELLWAVFHLTEELALRIDLKQLPNTDYQHLSGDIKRADVLLISEWLSYVRHLRDNYPYLFSLAARMNPFDPNASPIVA